MKGSYFILFLFLFACKTSSEWNAAEVCKQLFEPDEGQFRKFEIGMDRTAFDAAYTGDAIYATPNELIDSLSLDGGIYCETAFRFYKNRLAEIVVRIEIGDETRKEELLKAIKAKLQEDYGDFISERDYLFWRIEGDILTTDLFLSEPEFSGVNRDKKFVISLYYTVGSEVG